MSTVTQTNVISPRRLAWMDEHYRKDILCPFDGGTHVATLYMHGHAYGGQIECDTCDVSDMCEHLDTHLESVEVSSFYGGEDNSYDTLINVCDLCESTVDED